MTAVCSDNERVNMSQMFPQERGRGDWTAAPQVQPHPSVSALSCPVAPLSPSPTSDGHHLSLVQYYFRSHLQQWISPFLLSPSTCIWKS